MSGPDYESKNPAETVAWGSKMAESAAAGEIWALVGELGAGKTHFVKGLTETLGAAAYATSPTFTLVHEYVGGRLPVYHFDFYRLKSPEEALDLGLDEYLEGDGLTVIEWADKFPVLLPRRTVWFHFSHAPDDPDRRIIRRTTATA